MQTFRSIIKTVGSFCLTPRPSFLQTYNILYKTTMTGIIMLNKNPWNTTKTNNFIPKHSQQTFWNSDLLVFNLSWPVGFASILTVDPFPPTSRMTFQAMPRTWVSSKQDPIFQNGNNKKQHLHWQLHSTKWSEYIIILIHIALNLKRIQGEGSPI